MATEARQSRTHSPIVVTVDATRRCGETLEMAAALATSLGVDLEVVFVEDANLLRLADLPVTREVDRLSGTTRDLDSAQLLRALRCEARQLRHELERIGLATSVQSTLRVVRGQILSEALAASARVDVTFVHGSRRALPGEYLPGRARWPEMPAPGRKSGRRPRMPVWTLFEGGAASVRALQVAAKLAHTTACGLMVLVPYAGDDEAERRKREAQSAVDQVELRFLDVGQKQSLLQGRTLAPGAGSLLVLAKQSRELEDSATLRYLESLAVPLVLVA